ncbi:Uncharacterised protein [Mycobacteroides abscessus subsp. abscessus]|nr:Uncharacterised protein [Mycobacteroides abscessus subsp. abscessus]
MKSLTYSFEDPDGFFKSVKENAAEPLKNKYSDAEKLLKAIMLQAQVTSKGEIIASDAVAQTGTIMHPGDQKLLPEEGAPGKAPVPALPPLPALPGQK